jgi:hypothetical protein
MWCSGASFGAPQEVQFPKDHKGRLPFVISIAAGGEHSIAISDKPNEVRAVLKHIIPLLRVLPQVPQDGSFMRLGI